MKRLYMSIYRELLRCDGRLYVDDGAEYIELAFRDGSIDCYPLSDSQVDFFYRKYGVFYASHVSSDISRAGRL
jgi:hypothetical protein